MKEKLVLPIMKVETPCAMFRLGIHKEAFEILTVLSEKNRHTENKACEYDDRVCK